jgi:hypothetical protein
VPSVNISVPIAAYAIYGRASGGSAQRPVEGMRVVTVRELACKWLQRFGDQAQRTKAEQTYVGIFEKPEWAKHNLGLPFNPRLVTVTAASLTSVLALDAAWTRDESLDFAQSYIRRENGAAERILTSRSVDEVLEAWMNDVKPEGARRTGYRPETVLVNSAVWDGAHAHLAAALGLKSEVPA